MGSSAPHRYGRLIRIIAGWAGLLGIAACGGGGGGSSPPPPPAANQPPIAAAGNGQDVVEGVTVSLSAAGSSDPDGTIVSYQWAQVSGPDVTLENASSRVANFVGPLTDAMLVLEFDVTVTDDDGASTTDRTTVTVNPSQPPAVSAGPDDNVVENQQYVLDATVSDVDGSIAALAWQQVAGPAVTLSDSTIEDPSFIAPTVAASTDLEFELAATDSTNDTASDRVVITVNANEPPRVTVNFPCDGCRYFDSSIAVSGIANAGADNSFVAGLDSVTALTVDAGSGAVNVPIRPDGGWLAQNLPVAASQQSMVISVTAEDSFGESATTIVTLEHKPTITSASVAADASNPGLFYLVERSNPLDRVLSLDVTDGSLLQIYEASDVLAGFDQVQSVMLRPGGTSLLVNTFSTGLMQVDLLTGAITTVADDTVGTGPSLTGAASAAIDGDDNRVIVNNVISSEVIAVDLLSGNRTVVSSNDGVGSGPAFVDPTALTVDATSDVAYVRESDDNYLSISLTDGTRTLLPKDGAGSSLVSSLLFDDVRTRIGALDWFGDLVVAVNPATGRRDVLSFTPADPSLTTGNAPELIYDVIADRYVINDFSENISTQDSDQLLSVDPVTGTRAVLYKDTLGAGPSIQGLASVAADFDNGLLYLGSSTSDSISRVALNSGARTIVSSSTLGTGALIGNIRGLFADPANERLFMIDADSASLDIVDTTSGDRIRMSGGFVGSGPSMSLPVALTFDSASDTVYIVDEALRAIFAVDTLLGTRQIISDDSSAGTPFTEPSGIALDSANGRLLVTDNGTGNTLTITLYAVDLATGERTVVSSLGTGSGENFTRLQDVELVPDRDLAIVTTGESLIVVDLRTGNRTLLASSLSGNGESISNLSEIAFDPATNLVYGWNPNFEAVFVYSAETGDRVVLSK